MTERFTDRHTKNSDKYTDMWMFVRDAERCA